MRRKPPRKPGDLGAAIRAAFLYRWNLLALFGAVGGALLSGHPDLFLPFVAAAEVAYLGGLVSIPKFRRAVARQEAGGGTPARAAPDRSAATVATLLESLPRDARERFERTRARCLEMREIAQGVRARDADHPGEAIQTPALDRLLWVFLRLLGSQHALNRFLSTSSEGELQRTADDLRARLQALGPEGDERLTRSLTDSIAVAELRLDNYRKARANAEFVEIELDRIEAKIQALTEMSINRQDPDFLSSQVDAAAASMTTTESAISELQSITGIVDEMEEPPAILNSYLSERSTHVA